VPAARAGRLVPAEAQQQEGDHEEEGGKAGEEADFDRMHARILPAARIKNPARGRVSIQDSLAQSRAD